MKKLKDYNISFIGLKDGGHQFEYEIKNSFFELFDYTEFNDANIKVTVDLVKKPNMLELHFKALGNIGVNCDVSNEPFQENIGSTMNLVVKFGDALDNDNEEILIVPHNTYELNIGHYIYEMLILATPSKRVHPGVLDGTLKSDVLDKLRELEPKIVEETEEIDPRWNKLKGLIK
jgi:uncharacterized metal-binding protein YceD (DUF177 family)